MFLENILHSLLMRYINLINFNKNVKLKLTNIFLRRSSSTSRTTATTSSSITNKDHRNRELIGGAITTNDRQISITATTTSSSKFAANYYKVRKVFNSPNLLS